MDEKLRGSGDIVFKMILKRGQDSGMNPITGKLLKTFEEFICTYEQAFGNGIAAEVMKGITMPNGFIFGFRPYNDARVIGFLTNPNNVNTFKYFLGKTANCKNNDQLFLNEIIEYFLKENEKAKEKIFYVNRGRTNWGTVNLTKHNKPIAIRVVNEALVEIVKLYGIGGSVDRVKGRSSNQSEVAYLPTKADCEMALAALRKGGNGSSIKKEDVFEWLERDFQRREIALKSDWKVITERNLEIWFG